MKEAIVGIKDGEVRAIFCIDTAHDEVESVEIIKDWTRMGRTVKRCSQDHGWAVCRLKRWVEPGEMS